MVKVNKNQVKHNRKLSKQDQVYIGLDVHKRTISVAIQLNGMIIETYTVPAQGETLLKKIQPYQPAIKQIVYAAGPTGYSLARRLISAQYPCKVVAPSDTPQLPRRQNKTDRLDCRKLAFYASKQMLQPVRVPTRQEEADRQLIRLREQFVKKKRCLKQQIKSFLLQHGLEEPEGLSHWSQRSLRALQVIPLCQALRFSLDYYLDTLADIQLRLEMIDDQLRALAQTERHQAMVDILMSHPGVGLITAMHFRLELYDPHRFHTSAAVSSYLGLFPVLHQSGESRREGSISKTGRKSIRSKLIESAWRWMAHDENARQTYRRLVSQTGHPNKSIVGLARRLAIHLWKMQCDQSPYRKAS